MIYKSYLIEENFNLISTKINLFFGENLGLINSLKNQIKSRKNKNDELIILDQTDILNDVNEFHNEVLSKSLFSDKKIFFIEQVNDKILECIKEILDLDKSNEFYLFSNILDKKSKLRKFFEESKICGLIACYEDNNITLKKIVQNKLKGFVNLSPKVLNIIIENSGKNRAKLYNELNKIIIYFDKKKIDIEKLEHLLNLGENDNFNLLKDAALNGNKIKTNHLLAETSLDTDKATLYISLINQRLNQLVQINEISKNSNFEANTSKIKPPVFWKDKPDFMSQIKKWKKTKINGLLSLIYSLEIQIKRTSDINKKFLIKKLIIDICNLANT